MFKEILYYEVFHGLYLVGILIIYPLLILIIILNKLLKVLSNCCRNKNINGEIAVITGSGRGLGRDIATELAASGCHIAIVDIQEDLAVETAQYLNETFKVKTKAYKIDIRDYEKLQQLRDNITVDLGIPTILINNAGIVASSSMKNPSAQEIKQMIDVNFTALCYIHQIFLPKMKELNQGYIVNISSVSALFSLPFFDVYSASKAAVRSLTTSLRLECLLEGKNNIKILTVMPTFLSTNKRIEKAVNLGGMQQFLPLMQGKCVAKYIVDGMLSGSREITVPSVLLYIYQLLEILPIFIKELLMSWILRWKYSAITNSTQIAEVLKIRDLNVYRSGARDLGRDIAKELASKGCHIAIVDIQEKLALETAQYLTEIYNIKAKDYKIDISDYEQLEHLRDARSLMN